jgi:hypothetical protein
VRALSIRRAAMLTAIAVLFVFSTTTVSARESTPQATPDIPVPTDCSVEPLELMDLLPLAQGGGSSDLLEATPVAEDTLPEGVPANEDEIEGITATVRQLVACANARDPLRLVALLTDDFKIALASAALGLQGEAPEDLAARFPVPISLDEAESVDGVPMIPIRDARLLVDGRVAAILEPQIEGIDYPFAFYVTFELVDNRWLIDDVVIVEAAPASATPVA